MFDRLIVDVLVSIFLIAFIFIIIYITRPKTHETQNSYRSNNKINTFQTYSSEDRTKSNTDSYLIEYRYSGYPKKYMKHLYSKLQRKHKIAHHQYYFVPHISICGPIRVNNEKIMIQVVEDVVFNIASKFQEPGQLVSTLNYMNFDTNNGGKVLAIEVEPPKALKKMKTMLDKSIKRIPGSRVEVYTPHIWHTTIWHMKNNQYFNEWKFNDVLQQIDSDFQKIQFIIDRITLLKNGKIVCEFDLLNMVRLNRIEALDEVMRHKNYLDFKSMLVKKGESFD